MKHTRTPKELGIPIERAECFGKPHIGLCEYNGSDNKLIFGAYCSVCGAPATNSHHIVPKGMSGGSKTVRVGNTVGVKSSLIAVCGHGNMTGCHKLFHDGILKAKWVWDSEECKDAWWNGDVKLRPHSKHIFKLGHWEIYRNDKLVKTYGE